MANALPYIRRNHAEVAELDLSHTIITVPEHEARCHISAATFLKRGQLKLIYLIEIRDS